MEFLYFTVAGLVLYAVSDNILNRIEIARGERFANRSFIFLVIIMVLAVGSFSAIEYLNKEEPGTATSTNAVEKTTEQKVVEQPKK